MTQKSCIKHPEKSPLVMLRNEYLEITGNHCAAKILAIFEFWTNKLQFMGKARDWIYKTLNSLHQELMGEHGTHTIRKALGILENLGFISRRHNPHIKYDRTWQYKLEVENIQKALDNLIFQPEQMDDLNESNPSVETEESICQNCDNNIIDNSLDNSPKTKTQTPEVCEKEEELPLKVKQLLPILASEWRLFPGGRQAIKEQLAKFGLTPDYLSRSY